MFRKKIYGASQSLSCPFCGKQSITKNEQGVPVCLAHTKSMLGDLKCLCKGWLDLKEGKYGVFALCFKCGPMNLNRALEINPNSTKAIPEKTIARPPAPTRPTNTYPSFYAAPAAKPSNEKSKSFSVYEKKKETVVRSDELDFL